MFTDFSNEHNEHNAGFHSKELNIDAQLGELSTAEEGVAYTCRVKSLQQANRLVPGRWTTSTKWVLQD